MERGSDKHGRRLDDAMKSETDGMMRAGRDTHAVEWKSAEPSGEDQPDVDMVPDGTLSGGTPIGMDESDVEGRSELARHLRPSLFPAVRELLLDHVIESDAPQRIVDMVRGLPAGREFVNVAEAWQALGGHVESRRS